MRARSEIGRAEVTEALVKGLAALPCVHAVWEGGAASHGTLDEWSDIDLNVDAEDGSADRVFAVVERALRSLSGIEQKFGIPWPAAHDYAQAFYRVRGASPFLLVDLAVFKHSAPDKYLEPAIHGEPVFLFVRGKPPRAPRWDRRAFAKRLRSRAERLEARYAVFGCFIDKELERGNTVEALYNYQRLLLDPLLEFLRMRYAPRHFDFGVRYVHRELPARVVRRFETLAFVRDERDLRSKVRLAERWLRETTRAVRRSDVRSRLGT